jgi:Na+-transporting NADH:ubiquinone oxidoreductase subunit NqrF
LIHEVVLEQHLGNHPDPTAVEYYLCGPPLMIRACTKALADIGVPAERIAFDQF